MPAPNAPFEAVAEGLRVALKVTPKAARAGVAGVEADAAGRAVLKVRVTEAPEGGKANAAVIKLLAKAWKLPKGALKVVAGGKDRRKTLLVEGDPAELAPRLTAWLRTL
ncbi:MAG: DUF167 domain-containing protein [Proteobacteria bacterium]|nr:DUF167 domain-containing protein [Pseudomonadota bacterium]